MSEVSVYAGCVVLQMDVLFVYELCYVGRGVWICTGSERVGVAVRGYVYLGLLRMLVVFICM